MCFFCKGKAASSPPIQSVITCHTAHTSNTMKPLVTGVIDRGSSSNILEYPRIPPNTPVAGVAMDEREREEDRERVLCVFVPAR